MIVEIYGKLSQLSTSNKLPNRISLAVSELSSYCDRYDKGDTVAVFLHRVPARTSARENALVYDVVVLPVSHHTDSCNLDTRLRLTFQVSEKTGDEGTLGGVVNMNKMTSMVFAKSLK